MNNIYTPHIHTCIKGCVHKYLRHTELQVFENPCFHFFFIFVPSCTSKWGGDFIFLKEQVYGSKWPRTGHKATWYETTVFSHLKGLEMHQLTWYPRTGASKLLHAMALVVCQLLWLSLSPYRGQASGRCTHAAAIPWAAYSLAGRWVQLPVGGELG